MKKTVSLITVFAMLLTMSMGLNVFAATTGKTQMTNFNAASLNTDMWAIHSVNPDGTANAAKVTVADGNLNFVAAGDGCSFGPTGIYKNFTVRFDVLSVEEGSTFIGVCFGMNNAYDNFWDAGGNMVFFQAANTDAFKDGASLLGVDPAGVGTDNGGGRGWTRPGYELFTADGPNPEVLTYKLAVRNGVAEVYYKKASDPESVLDVLRIRIAGFADTTGFVKIASTAGANYKIDNFKIIDETPTSTNFATNSYDESMWAISSVNADGTAAPDKVKVADNSLVFTGAGDGCYFASTKTFKDFVLTFDVLSVEEGSTFIGACFGMDNLPDNFWAAGGNMVFFQAANTDAFKDGASLLGVDPAGVGTDNGGGRGWTRPGYELFTADGPNPSILNYKLVVKDGIAEVYYKKAADPDSVLNDLRIRIAGFGDTTGYVKIVSTAGASYKLDNINIYPIKLTTGVIADDTALTLPQTETTALASSATEIMTTSFKAQWTKDDGGSKYRVNVYTKGTDNSYTFLKTIALADVLNTKVEGLTEKTVYGFQVTSFDATGFVNNYYAMKDVTTAATVVDNGGNSSSDDGNPTTSDNTPINGFLMLIVAGALAFGLQRKTVRR